MAIVIPSVSTYGSDLSVPQVEDTATRGTQEYQPMKINNIDPADILPIIGQIET